MRKLGFFLAVMMGLLVIVFSLFQALPSADQLLTGQRSDAATTQAIVADLGLDQPLPISRVSLFPSVRFLFGSNGPI
jgi:ABC-type dipeptide/oligopeptide/nickel transport system permease component